MHGLVYGHFCRRVEAVDSRTGWTCKEVEGHCRCVKLFNVKDVWNLQYYGEPTTESNLIYKGEHLCAGTEKGADLGPLISPEAKKRVCDLVQSGVDAGAELLLDGRNIVVPGYEKGNFVGPTILHGVTVSLTDFLIKKKKTEIFLVQLKTCTNTLVLVFGYWKSIMVGKFGCFFFKRSGTDVIQMEAIDCLII